MGLRSSGRTGEQGAREGRGTLRCPGQTGRRPQESPHGRVPAAFRRPQRLVAPGGETTGCSDVSIQFAAFSIIPPSSLPTDGNEELHQEREPAWSGNKTAHRSPIDRAVTRRTSSQNESAGGTH